jgi:hypothetical protein
MYDDFTFKTCELEKQLTLEQVKERLDSWEEFPGTFTPMGDRGARFSPDSWEIPTVYFPHEVNMIEVVTKDLDLHDVEDFLCKLARRLDSKIFTENLEYW